MPACPRCDADYECVDLQIPSYKEGEYTLCPGCQNPVKKYYQCYRCGVAWCGGCIRTIDRSIVVIRRP